MQFIVLLLHKMKYVFVTLTSPPSFQDGSANENMLAGLAEDYAGRFRLESLGVYDALLDIWKHVTRVDPLTSPPTAAATAAAAVVVSAGLTPCCCLVAKAPCTVAFWC